MACKKKEYGVPGCVFTGHNPTISDIQMIVDSYNTAMRKRGMDPDLYKDEAELVVGPWLNGGTFRSVGWYLSLHNEGCCYHDL